ncbi:MAG: YndJ family transporter [Chloroflexi bacterium]|nr:YndJ family transporter [Chloroflexota bacterium]
MIELLLALALASAVPLGLLAAIDLLLDRPGALHGLAPIIAISAGLGILALATGRGPASALLIVPWWLVAAAVGLASVRLVLRDVTSGRLLGEPWRLAVAAAGGFLALGATWLVVDRAAFRPFGFDQTIVLLTAVHFHVAGFVLTLAGALAARQQPGIAIHALVAGLIVGMPLTALGFFGYPLLSWVGALLVATGGIGVGLVLIMISRSTMDRVARTALVVAGATLFLTMPLAAAYATGTTFGIGFLDIPAMAAIHGGLNVVGFAIPAMIGWSRLRGSNPSIEHGRP